MSGKSKKVAAAGRGPFLFPTYLGRSKGLCSQGTRAIAPAKNFLVLVPVHLHELNTHLTVAGLPQSSILNSLIALATGGTVLLPLESDVLWECPSRSQCYFVERMRSLSLSIQIPYTTRRCLYGSWWSERVKFR